MACTCTYARVPELIASDWADHLEAFGRRPSTVEHYGAETVRFGRWLKDRDRCVCEASRRDIEAYVGHLRRERSLGGRSIAARLSALRGLYRWLVAEGLVATNPTVTIPNPHFRKPLPDVLTADQLAVLLDLPLRDGNDDHHLRNALLLRTLAWTGLRVSEASRLDWDDVDLTAGAATIRIRDGKGARDRVVFPSQRGSRLSTRGMRDVVLGYGSRIGVKLSPHRLRAQCGVDIVRVGASLGEIRAVLGRAGYDPLLPYTAVAGVEAPTKLEAVAARTGETNRQTDPHPPQDPEAGAHHACR